MTYLDVISLLGGVALFLFGMSVMGNGLEKMSGGRLERILEKLTSNIFLAVLLGAVVTGIIQSSSATTVMLVGFVNAGIMKLRQAVPVIMGANIGTTVTAQILRLGDIDASNTILVLFKPITLAPIIAVAGIILYMAKKGKRSGDVGLILLGFAVLFYGMNIMETAVHPLAASPEFANLFAALSNPLLGVLAGAAITAIIQSSSASVGILQALSSTGAITFSAAVPIILGQNIGTCITAVLSSIGASKNGKRTAFVHLYFNVIGTVVFLIGIYAIQWFIGFSFWDDPVTRGSIANLHTVFNIVTTLLLLPFTKQLEKLAYRTFKDDGKKVESSLLDARFLTTPSVALERSHEVAAEMCQAALDNFKDSMHLLMKYDEKQYERIRENEDYLDRMEVRSGNYLVKLATDRDLSADESARLSEVLHTNSDIERIGDHVMNVAGTAQKISSKNIHWSEEAQQDLGRLGEAVYKILEMTCDAYRTQDMKQIYKVEPLEQIIDRMTSHIKKHHIRRLRSGDCQVDSAAYYLELLVDLERMADHCSNIAVSVVHSRGERKHDEDFDAHKYLAELHRGNEAEFNRYYEEYELEFLTPLLALKQDE